MPLRLSKHRVLLDGIPLNESQSSSLPSASTLDIWSVSGNIIPISGSATITGFTAAPQAGTRRTLLCTGTPTFTHSSTLLLPGSADYTATAGDRIEVLAVTTTQFRLSLLQTSVLHFATKSVFPAVGVDKALYLDKSTGLIWRWDTGTSSYVGAPFPIDSSGNVIANVSHRTGTLASLLALAGGAGEIGAATDADALVVFNGTALGAKAYYRSTKSGEVWLHGTLTNLTGGVGQIANLVTSTVNMGSVVVDVAANTFIAPAGTKYIRATVYFTVTSAATLTIGSKITCSVLGAFDIDVLVMTQALQALGNKVLLGGISTTSISPYIDNGELLKLNFLHEDASDVYASCNFDACIEFFNAN